MPQVASEAVPLLAGSQILFWFLLFVLGCLVGSFLNVCIYRLPRNMSVVQPPSHCPSCNTQLATRDLLPLVSQLSLGGRCRYCRAKISWRYFNIEFLTGVLFVLAGWWAGPLGINSWNGNIVGDWIKLLQGLIFMGTLVVIFWVDYDTRMIPLECAFLLGLAGVARDAWVTVTTQGQGSNNTGLTTGGFPGLDVLPAMLPGSLWAMAVASGGLWAMRAVFSKLYGREALGFGDVILVGAIAANLGWNGTLWTFAFGSVVLGAAVGVLLQIPRVLRARRWVRTRALKYLQRAQQPQVLAQVPTPQVLGVDDRTDDPRPVQVLEVAEVEKVEEESPEVVAADPARGPAWARGRAQYWQKLAPRLMRHSFRKAAMPFGPMLAIGAIAALLFGGPINDAYLRAVGYNAGYNEAGFGLDLSAPGAVFEAPPTPP